MDNTLNLQGLIDFGTDLLPQMQEFLDDPQIADESKEFIATNMLLVNSMLQTAIYFKGDRKHESDLIDIFSKTLEENYNFLRKILGY